MLMENLDQELSVFAICLAKLLTESPELAQIIEAWPLLPTHVRETIAVLVGNGDKAD